MNDLGLHKFHIFSIYRFLRSTAYREFTQLVHGYLGAKRIPLPACAYDAIRAEFMTDEDTDYTGYEDDED